MFLLFIEHLIHALSGQENSSSFLIKTLNDFLILAAPFLSNGGHSRNIFSI
jgi:hypothetical protein